MTQCHLNAVLYLVSHAATFKWRTKSVVPAAYEQKEALDKWEKKDAAKLAVEDAGDVRTEDEGAELL